MVPLATLTTTASTTKLPVAAASVPKVKYLTTRWEGGVTSDIVS